jgi:hypothetical protein
LSTDETRRHRSYAGLFQQSDDAAFLLAVREATDGGYPLVGDVLKSCLALKGLRVERGKPGPRARHLGEAEAINAELSLREE